jgi:hypothetical protein
MGESESQRSAMRWFYGGAAAGVRAAEVAAGYHEHGTRKKN